MNIEYYKVTLPSYLGSNIYECPISYLLKKYNYEQVIPTPFKCEKNKYIVAFPSNTYNELVNTLITDEDCKIEIVKIKYENITENFDDMYVIQRHKRIGRNYSTEYLLTNQI